MMGQRYNEVDTMLDDETRKLAAEMNREELDGSRNPTAGAAMHGNAIIANSIE